MNIPGGVYTITEHLLDGWEQTWPPAGYYSLLFDPSQSIDGLNFGNRPEPVGGIHGPSGWTRTAMANGIPNEPGLAGWTIRLEAATVFCCRPSPTSSAATGLWTTPAACIPSPSSY